MDLPLFICFQVLIIMNCTFGFNGKALRATHSTFHSIFCVRKLHDQLKRRCQLAASQWRFDSVGLFFFQETIQDKCYGNHPKPIHDLKKEIQVIIAAKEGDTNETLLKNWVNKQNRIGYCKPSRVSHMKEMVFRRSQECGAISVRIKLTNNVYPSFLQQFLIANFS